MRKSLDREAFKAVSTFLPWPFCSVLHIPVMIKESKWFPLIRKVRVLNLVVSLYGMLYFQEKTKIFCSSCRTPKASFSKTGMFVVYMALITAFQNICVQTGLKISFLGKYHHDLKQQLIFLIVSRWGGISSFKTMAY